MVLGMTNGELVIVVGIGMVMFGPQDLPKVARLAGRLVGWTAGTLFKARNQFQKIAGESEVSHMHSELQDTMRQLRKIQQELRMGTRFLHPGAFGRETHSHSLSGSSAEHMSLYRSAPNENLKPSNTLPAGSSEENVNKQQDAQKFKTDSVWQVRNPHWHKPMDAQLPLNPSTVLGDDGTIPTNIEAPVMSSAHNQAGISSSQPVVIDMVPTESIAGTRPLPISAASIGTTKLRGDIIPSGADIVIDALAEEQVARQAQMFLEGKNFEQESL